MVGGTVHSTISSEVDDVIFDLPTKLTFGGREWPINSDFRDVLRTLSAFEDPNLTEGEKAYICLHNMYPDMDDIPAGEMQAAFDAAVRFIDHGQGTDGLNARTMDWEQDAALIFPAVNRAAGFEVRSAGYIHWWTFLGYFMEIRNSTYATVLGLRGKRARGKKLEKDEQEFWQRNRGICELKKKYSDAEKAERDAAERMLEGKF